MKMRIWFYSLWMMADPGPSKIKVCKPLSWMLNKRTQCKCMKQIFRLMKSPLLKSGTQRLLFRGLLFITRNVIDHTRIRVPIELEGGMNDRRIQQLRVLSESKTATYDEWHKSQIWIMKNFSLVQPSLHLYVGNLLLIPLFEPYVIPSFIWNKFLLTSVSISSLQFLWDDSSVHVGT